MEANGQKCQYLDEFKILKTLGAGYTAVVKLGEDPKGQLVAIKRYKSQTSNLQTLIDELSIMKNLNQQNIVRLIAVRDASTYQRRNGTSYKCFAIVLEYCAGGELFDFVCDTGKFSQKVTRTYFHQMMSGLHYIHQKGYAHRDLKPQNLLLNAQFKLKLADFGFACLWRGRDGSGLLHTRLGTEGYMAPQIYAKNYEGKRTDVFAAGIILFIMYAGCPPFQKVSESDPYFKLLKAKQFDKFWKYHERKRPLGYFSDGFRSIFIHMTAFDPKQRPSIQQIATQQLTLGQNNNYAHILRLRLNSRKENNTWIRCSRKDLLNKNCRISFERMRSAPRHKVRIGQIKVKVLFLKFTTKKCIQKENLLKLHLLLETVLQQKKKFLSLLVYQSSVQKILSYLFLVSNKILLKANPQLQLQYFRKCKMMIVIMQIFFQIQITVQFSYRYGTQNEIDQILKIKLNMGLSFNSDLVVNFTKINGNFFYYRKVLAELRKGFVKQLQLQT